MSFRTLVFLVVASGAVSSVAAQVTLTVTTTDDELNSDSDCSLREAIKAANTNATVDGCTHDGSTAVDTIELTAGSTYTLSGLTTSGEDAAATGDLDLTDANGVIIKSATLASQATVNGNLSDRVFDVRAGDATFEDLIIRDGTTPDETGGGGGIRVPVLAVTARDITLTRVTLTSNVATGTTNGDGGGIAIDAASDTGTMTLTVTESTISANTAADKGGGVAINGDPTVLVQNSAISMNEAADEGGGFSVEGSGTVAITGSTISGNDTTGGFGAGIYVTFAATTIQHSSFLANDAVGNGGGIWSSGTLTVEYTTVSGNSATLNGGGLATSSNTVTITNSTISGNTANRGGGYHDSNHANTLLIQNTTISGNKATVGGAGIWVTDDGSPDGTLTNSIVTLNVKTDDTAMDECGNNTFSAGSNNIIDDTSCIATSGCVDAACTTAVTNFTASLASNGGPTQTHAITSSSNAVDAGTSCGLTSDQRGFTRDSTCDVGAYEGDSDADPGIFIGGTAGTGGDTGWRMLSAPCSGRTRANLSLNANISDDDEVRTYDESDGSGDAAWENVTSSTSLTHGRGFIAYLYDDATETVGTDFNINFAGCTQPTSDVTTTGLDKDNEEWYLAGNPFYESFDLSSLTFSGHQAVVKVWDPTSGGSGSYVNIVVGSDNDKIAMGQGFFVQRTTLGSGATQLEYASAGRNTGGAFLGKQSASGSWGRIGFQVAGTSATGVSVFDRASELLFLPEGTMGWDRYESTKNTPLSSAFVTLSPVGERDGADELLSLASYPQALSGTLEIPLQVDSRGYTGQVYLTWPHLENLPETWAVELIDHAVGSRLDLRYENGYHFLHESAAGKRAATTAEILEQPVAMKASAMPARFTLVVTPASGVYTDLDEVPEAYDLSQNYPNPFNPVTTIEYALPAAAHVRVVVYDVLGHEVMRLVDRTETAGSHRVNLDGSRLPSGVYIYELTAGSHRLSRTMLLLK